MLLMDKGTMISSRGEEDGENEGYQKK